MDVEWMVGSTVVILVRNRCVAITAVWRYDIARVTKRTSELFTPLSGFICFAAAFAAAAAVLEVSVTRTLPLRVRGAVAISFI